MAPRNIWIRIVPILLLVFILSGIAGWCASLAFSYHFAYDTLRTQTFENLRSEINAGAYAFRYGSVTAVDPIQRMITVSIKNNFSPDEPSATFVLSVPESSVITYQTLTGDNGVYTGISSDGPRPFTDITIGAHVAFLMTTDDKTGVRTAPVLLFGNPL